MKRMAEDAIRESEVDVSVTLPLLSPSIAQFR